MNEKKKREEEHKKRKTKQLVLLIAILVIAVISVGIIWFVTATNPNAEKTEQDENEIAYTELIKMMDEGSIEKIEMTLGSQNIKVKVKDIEEEKKAIVPSIQAFIELVQEKVQNGNEIELIENPPSVLKTIMNTFMSLLPTLLILALFIMMFKMQGLGEKGKIYGVDENKTDIRFNDVAGLDEEKGEMMEIVDFLKNPKKYTEMGAKIPRGILLYGKPGTGKTLIAKAIAGEAGVPFISMSGSEFIEMFAGLGASRVRKLFEKAKKISPCIVFIDEIDAIGARRTSAGGGAESENNQTLNQLLVEMDGFESDQTVIVLAATNRPEMLDKALLRPGRFDRQITIAPPDLKGREEILKIHAANKKFAPNIKMTDIAGDTAGFTGAELANVLNEAAIIATRYKHEAITQQDLEEAVKKITVGIEKQSRVMSEKDKKLTAYHEAGHAIVSKYLGTQTDVKEISIIPRGLAGGYTMYKTNEDKYYVSKTEMEEKLVALLGGRAAEKVSLNDISTGASNDLEVATGIAKDMITVYGMSDRLGPISLKTNEPYELQIFGEDIGDVVGEEIKALLDTAYARAQTILLNNMDKLHEVAQRLMEKEIISAEEFEEFFR